MRESIPAEVNGMRSRRAHIPLAAIPFIVSVPFPLLERRREKKLSAGWRLGSDGNSRRAPTGVPMGSFRRAKAFSSRTNSVGQYFADGPAGIRQLLVPFPCVYPEPTRLATVRGCSALPKVVLVRPRKRRCFICFRGNGARPAASVSPKRVAGS